MAVVSECATNGTSGWEVFFNPEGEVVLAKGDKAHQFPDAESVRYFLIGYEVASGECCGCDHGESGVVKYKVWRDGSSHVSIFDRYEDATAWMNFCDLASGECKMRYEVLK